MIKILKTLFLFVGLTLLGIACGSGDNGSGSNDIQNSNTTLVSDWV